MTRDPYTVLGVGKTASAKDIKSAYRKLAKKWHPDQNRDDPKAKERFAELSQAYDIIGDEEKRKAFDRGEIDNDGKPRFADFGAGGDPFAGASPFGRGGFRGARGGPGAGPGGAHFEFRSSGPGGPGGFDAGDIFSDIFGQAFSQGGQTRTRGPGSRKGEDLKATLDLRLEDVIGGGSVPVIMPDGRRLSVKLPDEIEDGKVIRLKGQGAQSPFGDPGDALVTIRLKPHPLFRLDGADLHADLPVSLEDAVLGAKVPVQTLAGRVAVTVPAWSSSDKTLRIKGRGLSKKGGGHGDLLVHVRIMLPEGGDEALAAFLRSRQP